MDAIVVELIDPRGRVIQRVRLAELPASFGRAAHCDVVVDDPSVSSEHAFLEADSVGELTLTDAESKNGLWLNGRRLLAVDIDHGTVVRLGEADVRFVLQAEPAPKTAAMSLHSPLERRPIAALALSATLLLSAAAWQASQLNAATFSRVMEAAVVPTLVAVVGWAFTWALLGRLLRGRFRFAAHLVIACSMMTLLWVYELTKDILDYHLGAGAGAMVALGGAVVFLGGFGLGRHLTRVSTMKPLTAAACGMLLVFVPFLLAGLSARTSDEKFSSDPSPQASHVPPTLMYLKPLTQEAYYALVDELVTGVEADAK